MIDCRTLTLAGPRGSLQVVIIHEMYFAVVVVHEADVPKVLYKQTKTLAERNSRIGEDQKIKEKAKATE